MSSCAFKHKKYENPITADTQQPDKILFDKAIKDLEKGRYEIARITLNTLINTYESSEYLAKAKLAIADAGIAKAARAAGLRRKPSTRTSSCSIPPWRKRRNRRKSSA